MKIAVYSDSPHLLAQLTSMMPAAELSDGSVDHLAEVAIIDSDCRSFVDHDTSARIWLSAQPNGQHTTSGDFTILRSAFLAAPEPVLQLASGFAELQARLRILEQERDLADRFRHALARGEFDELYASVTAAIQEKLGASGASLLLQDPAADKFVVAYATHPVSGTDPESLPGIDRKLLQAALGANRRYAANETTLIVPLQIEDDLVGIYRFDFEHPAASSSVEASLPILRDAAEIFASVCQLARSRELALRDDLTKAFNRRFFERHLEEEVERARRYRSPLSVIFLDLDELKLVNSRYGHLAGSRTLQEVARRILGAVRGIDKVIRFGGDEFCIVLPETDADQAMYVAQRVRRAISESRIDLLPEGTIEQITASFGIATYPLHATTRDELVRKADEAMFTIKSRSKNAIAVATPLAADETPTA